MKTFRLKTFASTLLAGVLACTAIVSPVVVPLGIASLAVTQVACGPDDLEKLHNALNQAAKTFEAAIDTNGDLYAKGIYGPVGSAEAIERRQKGAKIIHDGNEHLITALTLAKGLTKQTFEAGKLAVLQALSQAGANLITGNQVLDLALQAVATFINQAVVIVQVFKSEHLPRVLPEIQTWKLERLSV